AVLRGPPGGTRLRLRLRGEQTGPWQPLHIADDEGRVVALRGLAGPGGLALDLDAGEGVALGDHAQRRVGVGVVSVSVRPDSPGSHPGS
uniref:hypothetical protein n=1 Tax=Falsiroseomonas oryziterrae TaxID=2911368 RepID=UPI001F3FDCF8